MNKELFNLLMQLEYKFELELDEYFNLGEPERNELTISLVKYFLPYLLTHHNSKKALIISLQTIILESEINEEYEKAEIFNRFLKEVELLIF